MSTPVTDNQRFGTRLATFSLVFPVVYTLAYYNEWAVFRFYPQVVQFHLAAQSYDFGPGMIYYGWVVLAFLAALAAAMLVPTRWISRLWSGWSWIIPLAATLFMFLYETRWFLR